MSNSRDVVIGYNRETKAMNFIFPTQPDMHEFISAVGGVGQIIPDKSKALPDALKEKGSPYIDGEIMLAIPTYLAEDGQLRMCLATNEATKVVYQMLFAGSKYKDQFQPDLHSASIVIEPNLSARFAIPDPMKLRQDTVVLRCPMSSPNLNVVKSAASTPAVTSSASAAATAESVVRRPQLASTDGYEASRNARALISKMPENEIPGSKNKDLLSPQSAALKFLNEYGCPRKFKSVSNNITELYDQGVQAINHLGRAPENMLLNAYYNLPVNVPVNNLSPTRYNQFVYIIKCGLDSISNDALLKLVRETHDFQVNNGQRLSGNISGEMYFSNATRLFSTDFFAPILKQYVIHHADRSAELSQFAQSHREYLWNDSYNDFHLETNGALITSILSAPMGQVPEPYVAVSQRGLFSKSGHEAKPVMAPTAANAARPDEGTEHNASGGLKASIGKIFRRK